MSAEDGSGATALADADATTGDSTSTSDANGADEGRLAVLAAENRRLREQYARLQTSRYRQTAVGLAGLGVVALAGGLLFPDVRTVLFSLAAVGLFAGLLTFYLTPERFIPATVGERIYAAHAETGAGLVADLGLRSDRLYVPTDEGVRLFVPQQSPTALPADEDLADTIVVPSEDDRRGLAVEPTGSPLFAEFERAVTGDFGDDLTTVTELLGEGLVEQFELVDAVDVETTDSDERITVGVAGSAYGAIDRFDHPIPSFLAVGLAKTLDRPIAASVGAGDDRWPTVVSLEVTDGE